MSFLSKIVKYKKKEVNQKKLKMPQEELLKSIMKTPANRNFRDVFEYNNFVVIGEIKKKAPSTGVLRSNINVGKMAKVYEDAGIKAISVVTDKKFFDGKLEYIKEVKKACGVPVLRKDFIIDEYQIYETREATADAILLIAALFDKRELNNFVKKARFLNLTPIVEVHSNEDVKKAVGTGVEIIGINTRDLKTFKTNLSVVSRLIKKIPKDRIVICESGLKKPEDIDEVLIDSRIRGVLVGTMFMKAKEKNIKQYVSQMLYKGGNE
jgi:indole-3-glycerol phosphate synthase